VFDLREEIAELFDGLQPEPWTLLEASHQHRQEWQWKRAELVRQRVRAKAKPQRREVRRNVQVSWAPAWMPAVICRCGFGFGTAKAFRAHWWRCRG